MLIMAEVTAEMGAELKASATAAGTSVAAEVGRRLERLERLETTVGLVQQRVAERSAVKSEADYLYDLLRQAEAK